MMRPGTFRYRDLTLPERYAAEQLHARDIRDHEDHGEHELAAFCRTLTLDEIALSYIECRSRGLVPDDLLVTA